MYVTKESSLIRQNSWISIDRLSEKFSYFQFGAVQTCRVAFGTSGYPWSDPIRLNIFSYELSLIGIFLGGVPGANVFAPGQNLGWSF